MIVIVSTRLGTLSADIASGAVVRGNGSNLLWISGTAAQVNAKLATLTYAGTTAGTDDLSVLVLAADGTLMPALRSTVAVIPLVGIPPAASSTIDIDSGTLTIESRTLNGPNLTFHEPSGSSISTTCLLINSTIGGQSQITVHNDNGTGGVAPRVAIAGRVELDGAMAFAGNGTSISLAQGATFMNEGSISTEAHAAQFTGGGTLVNDGRIVIIGDKMPGADPRIDTNVAGSGVISLVDGASLEIGASVAASETISLGAGANTLHLTQPGTFAGQIAGFSVGDRLMFDGVTITNALVSRTSDTSGAALTLFNGTSIVGTVRFSAPDAGTVFRMAADASGISIITLVPVPSAGGSTSVDVFRFFDAAHGTQLLTQDPAERDAIIGNRPDLRYEGVGLHALDPAQPDIDATAVYRFFDVSNGTHFMTASTAERDSLLGSRPDLVFEPNSTFYEHASAQAGDTAVYRFFDSRSGAHFFTADPGERASILATRPDMTFEGVAFYAPKA